MGEGEERVSDIVYSVLNFTLARSSVQRENSFNYIFLLTGAGARAQNAPSSGALFYLCTMRITKRQRRTEILLPFDCLPIFIALLVDRSSNNWNFVLWNRNGACTLSAREQIKLKPIVIVTISEAYALHSWFSSSRFRIASSCSGSAAEPGDCKKGETDRR